MARMVCSTGRPEGWTADTGSDPELIEALTKTVPVTVKRIDDTTGQMFDYEVIKDDGIRHGLTMEKVSKLKPVFGENGKSTAGNS